MTSLRNLNLKKNVYDSSESYESIHSYMYNRIRHKRLFSLYKLKLYIKVSEVAHLCPILCNPMDCSLPGSSFHGIFQARILEWVAISFSRSSQPRDWTWISCIVDRHFTIWATREVKPFVNSRIHLNDLCKMVHVNWDMCMF